MNVTSTTYSHAEEARTCSPTDLDIDEDGFCDIDIYEPTLSGYPATLTIRFRRTPQDLLFFDQLRSAVEQVAKLLRP